MIGLSKKYYIFVSIFFFMPLVLSLVLALWLPMGRSFIIVFGSFGVFFPAGFLMTLIFFPCGEKSQQDGRLVRDELNRQGLDFAERILLSPFLSIAVIIFLLKILQYLKVPLSSWRIFYVIVSIIIFELLVVVLLNGKEISKRIRLSLRGPR